MRALDIVGEDLKLGLGIRRGALFEQDRTEILRRVGLLRVLDHFDPAEEIAGRLAPMDRANGLVRSAIGFSVDRAGDKGISAGEESTVRVKSATILESNIGVASKDLSQLRIEQITITDCNTGYAAYQKKPEFGPASIIVENDDHTGSKYPMMIERGSYIVVNGKRVDGTEGSEI